MNLKADESNRCLLGMSVATSVITRYRSGNSILLQMCSTALQLKLKMMGLKVALNVRVIV